MTICCKKRKNKMEKTVEESMVQKFEVVNKFVGGSEETTEKDDCETTLVNRLNDCDL